MHSGTDDARTEVKEAYRAEIIERVNERGITTDHGTVDGLAEYLVAKDQTAEEGSYEAMFGVDPGAYATLTERQRRLLAAIQADSPDGRQDPRDRGDEEPRDPHEMQLAAMFATPEDPLPSGWDR